MRECAAITTTASQSASEADKALTRWYQQVLFILDFAIPLVRDMDFCLSSQSAEFAARYQVLKEHALLLQLIICHPTRSKYAVPSLLERRYRDFIRSQRGPIAELDKILCDNPFLLSSERLEILIGLAASGNGMNHVTSTESGCRNWMTTLISSLLSSNIKRSEKPSSKFHRVFVRNSPGVTACVEALKTIASVRV